MARFLLWGDSHAHAVSELVHEMAVKHQLAGFVAVRHGCVPLLEAMQHTRPRRGQKWNQKVIQFIKEKKIRNVILVSRWDVEVNDPKTALVDNPSDTPSENSRAIVFQKRLARTLVELEQAGARVWLMQDVPTNNYDVRRMLASKIMFHLDNVPDPVSLEKHRDYQATVTEFFQAAANNRVKLVDPPPTASPPRDMPESGTPNFPITKTRIISLNTAPNNCSRPFSTRSWRRSPGASMSQYPEKTGKPRRAVRFVRLQKQNQKSSDRRQANRGYEIILTSFLWPCSIRPKMAGEVRFRIDWRSDQHGCWAMQCDLHEVGNKIRCHLCE